MAEFASKGVGGTALGLSIGALGAQALTGGLGNLLGGMGMGYNGCNGWNRGMPIVADCSDNQLVNRYEAGMAAKISSLENEVKLRDANTYTDQKLLEMYRIMDNKIECIEHKLCDQAVWNTAQTGTINCMAGQIAQLYGLTKLVVPNTSICPGYGNVTITPATTTTTTP